MKDIIENSRFRLDIKQCMLFIKNDRGDMIDKFNLYGLSMKDSLGMSQKEAIEQDLSMIASMIPHREQIYEIIEMI